MVSQADLITKLNAIKERHLKTLHKKIDDRKEELKLDNTDHYDLYKLLGFEIEEGKKIDLYQNIGRFLFKYAGSLLEEVTREIINNEKSAKPIKIKNTVSDDPANFEIDCYVKEDNKAHEIKWRDATTDGDHIKKEMNKLQAMADAGLIPVKIMFYMPNRKQAKRIQVRMIEAYEKVGEAYVGEAAYEYIKEYAKFDLKSYLFS